MTCFQCHTVLALAGIAFSAMHLLCAADRFNLSQLASMSSSTLKSMMLITDLSSMEYPCAIRGAARRVNWQMVTHLAVTDSLQW